MRRILIITSVCILLAVAAAFALHAQPVVPAGAPGATAPGAGPDGPIYRPWAAAALLTGFALLICLPFLPGLAEVYWPRDRYPLPIDTQYTKDPRYLGKSARRVFAAALEKAPEGDGPHLLWMSREEQVVISGPREIPDETAFDHVLYVGGDLATGRRCHLVKEVYATGDTGIGGENTLRTLAVDGDLTLGEGSRIARWVDAEGDLAAGESCDLGHSASCGGRLSLANAVTFRRLYGETVATPGGEEVVEDPRLTAGPEGDALEREYPGRINDIRDLVDYRTGNLEIPDGQGAAGPLVVRGDLVCGKGASIRGPLRVHGKVLIGAGAVIDGDVFAEGSVTVGRDAVVTGNVFSQNHVDVRAWACLGRPGAVKTVVGKRSITLAEGVRLHGYALTDGRGKVLCGSSS